MKNKVKLSSTLLGALVTAGALSVPIISNAAGIHCAGIATKWVNDCKANGHECASMAKSNFDKNEWLKMSKSDCMTVKKALKNSAVKKYVEQIQKRTVAAVKRKKSF